MSKIVWDGTGQRFYEDGVDRGVLFPKGSSGYEKGVAWNGLTAVNESNEGGDVQDIWADNIKYLSLRSQERFSGTIEAYTYPEEFRECDGTVSVADGVYVGQQNRKPFGLSYRSMIGNDQGSEYYQIHLVWNATADASGKDHATRNDSPDPGTFSWDFKTDPPVIDVEGIKPTAHMIIDSRYCPKEKLDLLEDYIYGVDADAEHSISASDPTMPTPEYVIDLVGTTTTNG